ncbi:hypothetical protein BJ742DRAFT_741295 [Cladochytrium replicatum]|nr:hypothetical protein BJ742DRAFT_741295 [Cladochytrium replicatum]
MPGIVHDSYLFVAGDSTVCALEKSSGKIIWSTSFSNTGPIALLQPHPPTRSLLVGAGPVLICISAETGVKKWGNAHGIGSGYSVLALEPSPSAAPSISPTSVLDSYVYAAVNGRVRAMRLDDGADLWEFKTPWLSSTAATVAAAALSGGRVAITSDTASSSLPALLIEDGVLYFSGNRRIWALDARNGHELWCTVLPISQGYHNLATTRSSQLSRPARFDPTSSSGYDIDGKSPLYDCLFVGASGYITRLSKVDGSPVAVTQGAKADISLRGFGAGETDTILLPVSNTAIVGAGSAIRRVNLSDGQTLWQNALRGVGIGSVGLLVGSGVTAPGAYDEAAGNEGLPAYDAGPSGSSSSAASLPWLDRVFVAVNGRLLAVRVTNGETLWTYEPSFFQRILRPAHLLADGEGRVYLAGGGAVHCVDANAGFLKWKSKAVHGGFAIISSYKTGNGETNRSNTFTTVIKQTKQDIKERVLDAIKPRGGGGGGP